MRDPEQVVQDAKERTVEKDEDNPDDALAILVEELDKRYETNNITIEGTN